MQIQAETKPIEQVSADALAVICFESAEEKKPEASPVRAPEDPAIVVQSGWMAELRKSGEFTGKLYEIAILHRPEGLAAKRLVVFGGGKREKFSTAEARRAAGVLARSLKGKGVRTIALALESEDLASAAVEGALVGAWEPDKYKTDPKKSDKQIDSFTVAVPNGNADVLAQAVRLGRIVGEAQNLARDLANEPANQLTPAALAEAAKEMATQQGLAVEVLDRDAMAELGMGALLGVAQGSSNPPYLVSIQYRPSIVHGSDHLALIGKGVTFDTGGISIKPADGMEKMKYDMSGAAAVIGAMAAIAQLKPSIPVTGYIPTVENMLNGNAQRPGDIVKTMSGKTVDVLNTDAEGRLILADAITYAKKNGATHLVDAATLTGAIGIALGHYNMGAFTNDDALLSRLLDATKLAGEKTWQLPMDEEYKEYLKSPYADLPNIGGRYGGSITAAWFLREFADPTPWVHLDIASTAWSDDGKAWLSKGPTGVTVRSFIALATHWVQPGTNPAK
ncbi:MAG TPA: leucyl aminopeptidase [Bryobacteraceae bacterium]|jgi:leucyl aminopeptidase|nr:leucyl aminopeptidase [Bryobacteraceae bacterium]